MRASRSHTASATFFSPLATGTRSGLEQGGAQHQLQNQNRRAPAAETPATSRPSFPGPLWRHGVDRSGVARRSRTRQVARGASLSAETLRGRGVLDDRDVLLLRQSLREDGIPGATNSSTLLEPLHPKTEQIGSVFGLRQTAWHALMVPADKR